MNFQVPQFIETEDKIVGPLTLRQFLYLAFGAGLSFLLFFFLNTGFWILFTFFLAIISISFAFIKVNGRPLSIAFLSATRYYWKPRMYLWRQEMAVPAAAAPKLPEAKSKIAQAKSRLDSLWEQLKTSKEPIPKREKKMEPSILDRVKSSKERFEMMRKITGEQEMARRVDYR
ncbi:MAG: PrgI family protein [Candidatus Harrisonbacteria bacterium]|nr:PrgI family protein [Candidatus Harrisonbacteria bacterium]